MVITIEIKDGVANKIINLLKSYDDIKIIKKESEFIANIKRSEEDLMNKNLISIDDVDSYIDELKNEIEQDV